MRLHDFALRCPVLEQRHQAKARQADQSEDEEMAFVDITVSVNNVSPIKVRDIADRLVNFARTSVSSAAANEAEDNTFTARRLKSGRLPEVQSCQSSIFRELRLREMLQSESAAGQRGETSVPRQAGIKARIGKLFAAR